MRCLPSLTFAAALLSVPLGCVAAELPDASLPVSSLLDSANALLAAGDMNGALDYFDTAIRKDPSNYLTIFKRGATYLSLGRASQASADFDTVLTLKPDFEAALLQRARIRAKAGDWPEARAAYAHADAARHAEAIAELELAEAAAAEAARAEQLKDYEKCVTEAGTAIVTASANPSLRSLRARCRLAKGDVHEAVGDLSHVAQLNPSSIEPHLQITNLLYYSLNDYDRAAAQMRKCLHSDPDSKACSKLFRRIKNHDKALKKAQQLREKRQFLSAVKILVGSSDEPGEIAEIADEIGALKAEGTLNEHSPQELTAVLQEWACDLYTELDKPDKAAPYCTEALRLNPSSLPGILAKANRLLKDDAFEEAIRVLDAAKEAHPNDRRLQKTLNEAHTLLRRSKNKDYYKVLDVPRDATEREIKKAYRKMTKTYHPDKYRGDLTPEQVQKKQAEINEAYEVLVNPELRARFDSGDDPNSQEQGHPFAQGAGHPFGGGQQFMFRQQGGSPFGGAGGFSGGQFRFNF